MKSIWGCQVSKVGIKKTRYVIGKQCQKSSESLDGLLLFDGLQFLKHWFQFLTTLRDVY